MDARTKERSWEDTVSRQPSMSQEEASGEIKLDLGRLVSRSVRK